MKETHLKNPPETTKKAVKNTAKPIKTLYKAILLQLTLIFSAGCNYAQNEECMMTSPNFVDPPTFSGTNPEPRKQKYRNTCRTNKFRFGAILKLSAMPDLGSKGLIFAYHKTLKIYFERVGEANEIKVWKYDELGGNGEIHRVVIGSGERYILIWYEVTQTTSQIAVRQASDWNLEESLKKAYTFTVPFEFEQDTLDNQFHIANPEPDKSKEKSFRGNLEHFTITCSPLGSANFHTWKLIHSLYQSKLASFYLFDQDRQAYTNYYSPAKQPIVIKGDTSADEGSDPSFDNNFNGLDMRPNKKLTQDPVDYKNGVRSVHVTTHLIKVRINTLPSPTSNQPQTFYSIYSDKLISFKISKAGALSVYGSSGLLFESKVVKVVKGAWHWIKLTYARGLRGFYECSASMQIFEARDPGQTNPPAVTNGPTLEDGFYFKCSSLDTLAGGNPIYPKVVIGDSTASIAGSHMTFTISQLNQFLGGASLQDKSFAKACDGSGSLAKSCTLEMRYTDHQYCLNCLKYPSSSSLLIGMTVSGVLCQEVAVGGNHITQELAFRPATPSFLNIYYACEAKQFVGTDNSCRDCSPSCASCAGQGASQCTHCPWRSNKALETTSGSSKGTCDDCASGKASIFGACQDCPYDGCTSCPLLVCDQCQKNENFKQGHCCPKDNYRDTTDFVVTAGGSPTTPVDPENKFDHLCKACDSSCKTCYGPEATNCLSCNSTSTLDLLTNKCQFVCDTNNGKYIDSTTNECKDCPKGCSQCSDATTCTSCKTSNGYYLSGTQCLTCNTKQGKFVPPSGDACLACEAGCAECSDAITCTKCKRPEGFYLSNADCLPCDLNGGKFIPPAGATCEACSAGCSRCPNRQSCQVCDSSQGFVRQGPSCVTCATSDGKFVNKDNSPPTCDSCSANCLQCSSQSNCTLCSSDYQVDSQGACVEKPSSIEEYNLIQALPSVTDDEADFKLRVSIPGASKFGGQLTYNTFKPPEPNPRPLFKIETAASETAEVGEIASTTRLTQKNELIVLGNFSTKPTSTESKTSVEVKLSLTVLIDNIINLKPGIGLALTPVPATVTVTPKIEKKVIEAAKEQGQAISGASSTSSSAAAGASTIFSALGADPTGLMIKFNQYLDFISRLRLININFGAKLEAFLGSVGEAKEIKAETGEEKDEIVKAQNGDKGKFNEYYVKLGFEGRLMYKSGLFMVSWLGKGVSYALLGMINARNDFRLISVYWIFWSRKLHLLVLGTTMSDISFYGARVLLHSSSGEVKRHPARFVFNAISVFLVVVDLVEIFLTITHLKEKPPKQYKTSRDAKNRDFAKTQNSKKSQISKSLRPSQQPAPEESKAEREINKNLVPVVIKKKIDEKETIARIQTNESIKLFSIDDLTPSDAVFVSKLCLLNNYLSILKMAFQLAVLASLAHLPSFQISLMLAAQIFDMGLNLYQFFKRRHLNSWIKMILRVSSALFISLFLLISLYIRVEFGTKALYIEKNVQDVASVVVMIGMALEYLFTFVLLVQMLVGGIMSWFNRDKIRRRREREELRGKKEGEVYSVMEVKGPLCYKVTKRAEDPLNPLDKLGGDSNNDREMTVNKLKSSRRMFGGSKHIFSVQAETQIYMRQAEIRRSPSRPKMKSGMQSWGFFGPGTAVGAGGGLATRRKRSKINLMMMEQSARNPLKMGKFKSYGGTGGMGNGGRPVMLSFRKGA